MRILPFIANMYILLGIKSKQARCKYCAMRMKIAKQKGVSPPTSFCCSFHDVAVCKIFQCWERHLTEVTRNARDGLGI